MGEMNSVKGKFLIASPRLADPNFARTVVLMIQHGAGGAVGLVINRESTVKVREALDDIEEFQNVPDVPLLIGGPCQGPLFAVHRDPELAEVEVIDGVYLCAEKYRVSRVLQDHGSAAIYIAGYAGWAEQQLESEMDEGSWLSVPARSNLVFEPGRDLWGRLNIHATLGGTIDLDRIPDDPSVN
jgi:putative transcriptional regulator